MPTTAPGGPSYAHVRFVKAVEGPEGLWHFEVTVQHEDEGEDHHADFWEVILPLPDGQFLVYTRELTHPHIDEQPFTRSLRGVEIPDGVTEARVRAHDNRHGFGGQEVIVDLTAESGPGFLVVRP